MKRIVSAHDNYMPTFQVKYISLGEHWLTNLCGCNQQMKGFKKRMKKRYQNGSENYDA